MFGEAEEQHPIFHDSWKRLGWVERQAGLAQEMCAPLMGLPRHAALKVTVDESVSSEGQIEFMVDVVRIPEVPDEVNFLIGDVVTNARSCLDMAVDSIWNHYSLDRKRVSVQFPLEGDYQSKLSGEKLDKRFKRFIDLLDQRFVRVIEQAQPEYAGGLVDIPANLTALCIGYLSNANKHRNITPVIMHISLDVVGHRGAGLRLDAADQSSTPPIRFRLAYDAKRYTQVEIRGYIAALERPRSDVLLVGISQQLVIDRQSIPISPPGFLGGTLDVPAKLGDLLDNVPEYVRLVLRNLNRAHRAIQAGEENVFLDYNGLL